MTTITVGTLIESTLALEWDVDRQKVWLYRLNNHWASLYDQQDLAH